MTAETRDRGVEVEFFGCSGDIDESLWSLCFPAPLEGRFWYRALEASGLEDQFTFLYALIRVGGEPAGIAPCFVHDVAIAIVAPRPVALAIRIASVVFPRAGLQRTLFVGSPCSDEGTIGLLPGVRLSGVAAGLGEALLREARRRGASMIVFKDFPEAGLDGLDGLSRGRGLFRVVSYPGTRLALPGPDVDAYLRALSAMRRHNFRKKIRRSREQMELETTVVQRPPDTVLREVDRLFQQTFEKGRTKFERLGPEFFRAIGGEDPAHFILLRNPATGELLAFMLVFCVGPRVINKFIGIDYRAAPGAYLYFRLFDAALRFAYARGATELQSGQTGYRAKLDLGHEPVPLFNLARHRNRVVNAVYRAIASRVSWETLDKDLAVFLLAHPECQTRPKPTT